VTCGVRTRFTVEPTLPGLFEDDARKSLLRSLGFRPDARRATAILLAQAAQVALEITRCLRSDFKPSYARRFETAWQGWFNREPETGAAWLGCRHRAVSEWRDERQDETRTGALREQAWGWGPPRRFDE